MQFVRDVTVFGESDLSIDVGRIRQVICMVVLKTDWRYSLAETRRFACATLRYRTNWYYVSDNINKLNWLTAQFVSGVESAADSSRRNSVHCYVPFNYILFLLANPHVWFALCVRPSCGRLYVIASRDQSQGGRSAEESLSGERYHTPPPRPIFRQLSSLWSEDQ